MLMISNDESVKGKCNVKQVEKMKSHKMHSNVNFVHVFAYVYTVCMREKEREREGKRGNEKERGYKQ